MVGGGGSPIVTTSLVGSGHNRARRFGSVNFAEFGFDGDFGHGFFVLLDGEGVENCRRFGDRRSVRAAPLPRMRRAIFKPKLC